MGNLKATYLNEFKSIDLKEENIKFAYGYALKGFTADLTDAQVEILRKDPRVKSIEQILQYKWVSHQKMEVVEILIHK